MARFFRMVSRSRRAGKKHSKRLSPPGASAEIDQQWHDLKSFQTMVSTRSSIRNHSTTIKTVQTHTHERFNLNQLGRTVRCRDDLKGNRSLFCSLPVVTATRARLVATWSPRDTEKKNANTHTFRMGKKKPTAAIKTAPVSEQVTDNSTEPGSLPSFDPFVSAVDRLRFFLSHGKTTKLTPVVVLRLYVALTNSTSATLNSQLIVLVHSTTKSLVAGLDWARDW